MNFKVIEGENVPIKAWVNGVQLEDEALKQLKHISSLPFIHRHIAVMPDVHAGKGSTVGSVIPTYGAIIPAAVGVDIGCGMMAVKTNLKASDLPDNLFGVRSNIEAAVPHGRTANGGPGDRGAWGTTPLVVDTAFKTLDDGLNRIVDKHPKIKQASERAANHLGTLGTGNHFVELCLDENDDVWVMLHSGSRGIGNRIGSYFIEIAKQEMERYFISLPDKDLSYLPEGTEHFNDYVAAVGWAQGFAMANRRVMMANVLDALRKTFPTVTADDIAVNCHHNYVQKERHLGKDVFLTRKGAVSAQKDELGIIPGSMGAKSFIVRGRGNHESFCSCSHGAGRKMSRTEAKRTFTLADHIAATAGVECRKDEDVIDETPAAYKDIDAVMAAQADLVEIVHTLRQVVCVKG